MIYRFFFLFTMYFANLMNPTKRCSPTLLIFLAGSLKPWKPSLKAKNLTCSRKGKAQIPAIQCFLAPTGALEEGMLSVRPCVRASVCPDFPQKDIEKEL